MTAVVGLRFLTTGMAALNAHHQAVSVATADLTESPVDVPVESLAESAREPVLVGAGGGAAGLDSGVDGGEGNHARPTLSAPALSAPAPALAPERVARQLPASAYPAGQRPTSMKLVHVWILLFGFVGTQLAWTLRPFFGDPRTPFALFREIDGTFYGDILHTIGRLLS